MAKYEIELPDHLTNGLAAVVRRYNENTGQGITVKAFLELHIAEIALADALAAEQQRLQQQKQAELLAELTAARDRLISAPAASAGRAAAPGGGA